MWVLSVLLPLAAGQFNNNFNTFNNIPDQPARPLSGLQDGTGADYRQITQYDGPLFAYSEVFGDAVIADDTQQGRMVSLNGFFPFYGGKYNYTIISSNGYIGFGYFSEQTNTFKIGTDVDWPTQSDPAIMAPYICRQKLGGSNEQRSKVFYRIEKRSSGSSIYDKFASQRTTCRGLAHTFCDSQSDRFLNAFERALQEGVAGGGVFRAEAALVVTWRDMMPNIGDEETRATYQLVWATDAQGHLSYTVTNYKTLNFDAADMNGNARTGRCQAVFNGGNHTGTVQVDMSDLTKNRPSSLAERSALPHVTRGRYVHRVDDIVRHAGCSNKTGGTHPLLVYPNIVNMLGQVTVEVNALCLDPTIAYTLMIESRQSAPCEVLNPSVARCRLPKILDWGTKTIYFQPQSGLAGDEKAFVGFIYFVPPTIDPTRLDIGNVNQWYKNPVQSPMTVKWYPRNFTAPLSSDSPPQFLDNSVYSVPLGLFVVGYREAQDDTKKKFIPQHRVLAKLNTYSNRAEDEYRWKAQVERVDLTRVDTWFLSEWERKEELFTYRFGYLKLAPIPASAGNVNPEHGLDFELPEGLVSAPISLHWLWTVSDSKELTNLKKDYDEKHAKMEYVKTKSREMCRDWYEEDGALNNFIRETETNSSCPCKEEQAAMDYGRFMPHPRCSKLFRDVTCTETLGSSNCYMSAQNVRGSQVRATSDGVHENSYVTHYGQTCCYDATGFIMQSSYQPVIKIDDSTPYSPGFPTRAYEHGTYPDIGMFEVPGLSTFHHDILPYYLCCKYTDFRCQLFYWRRPSSSCQAYEAPVTGSIQGAGSVSTLDGRQFVFNEPGVFTLLHAHKTQSTPEVQIQVRQERYPDRSVNFGRVEYNQDRVVPSNVTVVTGVALRSDGADTVHVLLRKDTYRMRYRTTIMVGNVVRYFDNMVLQKFRGVTIYVNNVNKGQSEVFVVLDNAQIGVRIRESYAVDMDVTPQFWESPGLLDVTVSVPPQYKVRSSAHLYSPERARVNGLLMPYPEQNSGVYPNVLQWSDVNSDAIRTTLLNYKVGNLDQAYQADHDVQDIFVASTQGEQLFQAFPDHFMKGPTYSTAAKYKNLQNYPFNPMNEQTYRSFIEFCRRTPPSMYQPQWEKAVLKRCPRVESMENSCANDVSCLFDSTYLQSQLLGEEVKTNFAHYQLQRTEAVQHFNSCGAMNLEYPEYLIKGPSSAGRAYLEGDTLQFSCYQSHIAYGDTEFTCQKVPLSDRYEKYTDGEHSYMMQWTSGSQPWCRHRAKDNVLTWLQWSAIIFGVLLLLIIVFTSCWAVKHNQRSKTAGAEIEMEPLDSPPKNGPLPGPSTTRYVRRTDTPQSDILPLDKEPLRKGSVSSLHHTFDPRTDPYSLQSTPRLGRGGPSPPEYVPRPGGSRRGGGEIAV